MTGTTSRALRAVVISGDARVRVALGGLIAAGTPIAIVETLEPGHALDRIGVPACPDVVVIDVEGRDPASWAAVAAAIREGYGAAAIVVVNASPGGAGTSAASDVDAVLSQLEPPGALCDAVRAVLRIPR